MVKPYPQLSSAYVRMLGKFVANKLSRKVLPDCVISPHAYRGATRCHTVWRATLIGVRHMFKSMIAMILALTAIGCADDGGDDALIVSLTETGGAIDSAVACSVANDCVSSNECTLPQCIDGVCAYAYAINGLTCSIIDGMRGVCIDGSCAPINAAIAAIDSCDGTAEPCIIDSDCFTRQCTSSMCVNGSCIHLEYEDGATCFDYADAIGVYFGVCSSCSCVVQ